MKVFLVTWKLWKFLMYECNFHQQSNLHFPSPSKSKGLMAEITPTAVPKTLPAVPTVDPRAWVPTVNRPRVLPCLWFSFSSLGILAPLVIKTNKAKDAMTCQKSIRKISIEKSLQITLPVYSWWAKVQLTFPIIWSTPFIGDVCEGLKIVMLARNFTCSSSDGKSPIHPLMHHCVLKIWQLTRKGILSPRASRTTDRIS